MENIFYIKISKTLTGGAGAKNCEGYEKNKISIEQNDIR